MTPDRESERPTYVVISDFNGAKGVLTTDSLDTAMEQVRGRPLHGHNQAGVR